MFTSNEFFAQHPFDIYLVKSQVYFFLAANPENIDVIDLSSDDDEPDNGIKLGSEIYPDSLRPTSDRIAEQTAKALEEIDNSQPSKFLFLCKCISNLNIKLTHRKVKIITSTLGKSDQFKSSPFNAYID